MSHKYNLRPSPSNHPMVRNAHRLGGVLHPLPSSTDLRRWDPGRRDQGNEGSCSGFSTSGFREVLHGSATKCMIGARLSPAYLYARTRMAEGSFPEDTGCTLADEFGVLHGYGVCPEDTLPYEANPTEGPTPIADAAALSYRIGEPLMAHRDALALKTVLAAGMPISIGIPVYSSFENPDGRGLIHLPDQDGEELLGGHALLLLGYNDAEGTWLIGNSWGTDWGDKGYCHLAYGYERLFWEAWSAPLVA